MRISSVIGGLARTGTGERAIHVNEALGDAPLDLGDRDAQPLADLGIGEVVQLVEQEYLEGQGRQPSIARS